MSLDSSGLTNAFDLSANIGFAVEETVEVEYPLTAAPLTAVVGSGGKIKNCPISWL